MAKRKLPSLSLQKWLKLAGMESVQWRIAKDPFLSVYPILIQDAAARTRINWQDAVTLLHVVYAWMPTMLRTQRFGDYEPNQKARIVKFLKLAQSGQALSVGQIEILMAFANNSVVGVSKLLHLLNPRQYPIWDSRVADVYLWARVSRDTFNRATRYIEYREQVLEWSADAQARRACNKLRAVYPLLKGVSNTRLIELVMFRAKEEKPILSK